MALPPNIKIITLDLRTAGGVYIIGGGMTHIYKFEIPIGGKKRIPIQQLPGKQSFSISAWIANSVMGSSLFFRFRPGFGGLSQLYYDVTLDPIPTVPHEFHFDKFAGQTFAPTDRLIGLPAGIYYYHVTNLEGQENAYKIGFMLDTPPINNIL